MGPHVRGPLSPQPACLQLSHQLLRSRSAVLCCAVLCCAVLCCAVLRCAMLPFASNAAVHAGLRYAWLPVISLNISCASQQSSTCDSVNMMRSKSCCCYAGGREAAKTPALQHNSVAWVKKLLLNDIFNIAPTSPLTLLVWSLWTHSFGVSLRSEVAASKGHL